MEEKIFNPAGYNNKAPQPGMAAVDTDNSEERQQEDKKLAALEEKPARYDEASSKGNESENNTDE